MFFATGYPVLSSAAAAAYYDSVCVDDRTLIPISLPALGPAGNAGQDSPGRYAPGSSDGDYTLRPFEGTVAIDVSALLGIRPPYVCSPSVHAGMHRSCKTSPSRVTVTNVVRGDAADSGKTVVSFDVLADPVTGQQLDAAAVATALAAPGLVIAGANVDGGQCIGSWSACAADCGDKTYTVMQAESGGGTACAAANGTTLACSAGDGSCPANVDCVGDYGTCNAGCTKTFAISTSASGTGTACSAAGGTTASCTAGEGSCPADANCVGAWSACDSACSKLYSVTTRQSGTGTACSAAAGDTATCTAGEESCPVNTDCGGSWDTCSASCTQSYTVSTAQSGSGEACTAAGGATQACAAGTGSCPADADCVGSWGVCGTDCAAKSYTVSTAQAGNGAACVAAAGDMATCAAGEGNCPANTDCIGSWSRCSAACSQSYSIITPRSGSGTACSAAVGEIQNCAANVGDCVATENCVGSWSACAADCGDKTYTVTQNQGGSGTACAAANGATLACSAGDGSCPANVDCVGDYGTCNAGCTKTFAISTSASGTGTACSAAGGTTASCTAGEGSCPADANCVGAWSACDSACSKLYSVTTRQSGTGTACSAAAGDTATCTAGEESCPVNTDCGGSWDTCSASCTQSYTVSTAQSGSGEACTAAGGATQACAAGTGSCPADADCVGSWGVCGTDCAAKSYTVSTAQVGLGADCPAVTGATLPCGAGEGDCPPDISCVGTWSVCSIDCEKRFDVATLVSGQGTACDAADGGTMTCSYGEDACVPPPVYAWSAPVFDICTTVCGPNAALTRTVVCEATALTASGATLSVMTAADSDCDETRPSAERRCPTVAVGSTCDDGTIETMNDVCTPNDATCAGIIPGVCSASSDEQGEHADHEGEAECISAGSCTDSSDMVDTTITEQSDCATASKTWTALTWTASQDCSTLDVSTPTACTAHRDHCTYRTQSFCQGKVALVAAVVFDIAIDDTALTAIADAAAVDEAGEIVWDDTPIGTTAKAALQPILVAAGMQCTVDDITILSITAGSLNIDYKVEVGAEFATPQIKETASAAVADPASVNLPADSMAITVNDPVTGLTVTASGAVQEAFKSYTYAKLPGSCNAPELCTGELGSDGTCTCSTVCGQDAMSAPDVYSCLEDYDSVRSSSSNEVQLSLCVPSLGAVPTTGTLCCERTSTCESLSDCEGDRSCQMDVVREAMDACWNETYREEIGRDRTQCLAAATGLSDATINQIIVICAFVFVLLLAVAVFCLWKTEHALWAKCCSKASDEFERTGEDLEKEKGADVETPTSLAEKAEQAQTVAAAHVGSSSEAACEARLAALKAAEASEADENGKDANAAGESEESGDDGARP